MSLNNTIARLSLAVGAAAVLTACSSQTVYYEVSEPSSGNTFYTTKIDRPKNDSYLLFDNAQTGAEVRLTQFQLRTITQEEFEAATKPAPAAATAAEADADSDG